MITFIDRNGPPEGLLCPAILCDSCLQPVNGEGWVLWQPRYSDDRRDNRPTIASLAFVHPGDCDHAYEQAHGHHYSSPLGEFLTQLAYNYANPFREKPDVEYVAPHPSTWRLGHRARPADVGASA